MIAGSSILAITRSVPPHCRQVSISMGLRSMGSQGEHLLQPRLDLSDWLLDDWTHLSSIDLRWRRWASHSFFTALIIEG